MTASGKILLVDDEPNALSAYRRNLALKFKVETALSAAEGINMIRSEGPYAVVVSDLRMPNIDGIKFLGLVRKYAPDTVRIMLTGQADLEKAIEAVNEGYVFRFLTKPCPTETFVQAITEAVEQYRLVTAEHELLDKTLKGSIALLVDILSLASPQSFARVTSMNRLVRKMASRLNIDQPWDIELGVLLSQIGCITVPPALLDNKYGGLELTENELELFFSHTRKGSRLLSHIPRLENISEAIAYQMKNYDGTGYPPDDTGGKAIPLIARFIKVAYDYIDLSLGQGFSPREALEKMNANLHWYDPEIMGALEAEVLSLEEGYVARSVLVNDLIPGMILADDIRDLTGLLVIPKGNEITEVVRFRLENYLRLGTIAEPLKILQKVEKKL